MAKNDDDEQYLDFLRYQEVTWEGNKPKGSSVSKRDERWLTKEAKREAKRRG